MYFGRGPSPILIVESGVFREGEKFPCFGTETKPRIELFGSSRLVVRSQAWFWEQGRPEPSLISWVY